MDGIDLKYFIWIRPFRFDAFISLLDSIALCLEVRAFFKKNGDHNNSGCYHDFFKKNYSTGPRKSLKARAYRFANEKIRLGIEHFFDSSLDTSALVK